MIGYFLPPEGSVDLALSGLARTNAGIRVNADPLYVSGVVRPPARTVGLVSGGGSGHEPLHAGFVGAGMLDAAVPGRVFASPHNRQIFAASLEAAGPDGVLHIVKNYTGDRINFGIAAERLRDRGIAVERVLVDDDLATDSAETATGRRGTGATVIVEKVLGGAADEGHGLQDLARIGTELVSRSRSIAVARRAHTAPSGDLAFDLGDNEIEYGVGIHGERAAETAERSDVADVVARMVDDIVGALSGADTIGPRTVMLINGLGSATLMELYVATELAHRRLAEHGIAADDTIAGTFVPALDMGGFSISISSMTEEMFMWWNAPTEAAGWPRRA